MKIKYFIFSLIVFTGTVFPQMFNSSAIWDASEQFMQSVTKECGLKKFPQLGECLVKQMEKFGASDEAVKFTRLIDNKGYMMDFRDEGMVDVAYVYYPFNTGSKLGYYLVNGSPAIIDVDNSENLPIYDMETDSLYLRLKERYPRVSIWAGDRGNTNYPAVKDLPHHGKSFIVNYRLKNGCFECPIIGYAEFAFDFDSTGSFKGARFLKVESAVKLNTDIVYGSEPKNVFTDPSKPINIREGEDFVISLSANLSTGYKWKLGKPLNNDLLKLVGTDYIQPSEKIPGMAGKEVWTFKAVGNGITEIYLIYVREWQPGSQPAVKADYKVNIY